MTKPKPGAKKGRPRKELTADQLRQVEILASCHFLKDSDIAQIIGVGETTLRKYADSVMKASRAKGRGKLSASLMHQAMSGKAPAIAIFLAKTTLGLKEEVQVQHSGSIDHLQSVVYLPDDSDESKAS